MLSYLDANDIKFFGSEMEKVINSASNSDVCFQFWELFLNSGLRRVRKNETLQSSHDRLLLGYHTHIGKGSKLEITPTSTRILKEEMKSHIKSYNDVMADIKELSGLCFDYQMAFGKVEYISHKYESFRFLVINTFINYFIDDAAYGFRLNGVSKFFDELIEGNEYLRRSTLRILTEGSNVRAISKEMRNILKIEYIDTSAMIVDDYYTQNSKNEVIVSDENSDKHRVVQFLRSVTANADKFTGLVIARFDMMSLSCMRIFFNDSINVYLPWMPACSSGKPGSKAHSAKVFPAKKLSEKAGMIYHEINWRSYASYNRIAATVAINISFFIVIPFLF